MGYVVKHSTSHVNKTRRKGNVALGVSAEGYDKTSVSGLYAGVPPVEGKHNFVRTSATGDPNFYCVDDTELINFVNSIGGSVSTILEAKNNLISRDDIMFTDTTPNNLVTDGLVLDLDAKNLSSFLDNKPTTNILPNADKNGRFTTENQWNTYNTNQYNGNTYFSIGTISSVSNNIVTLGSVGRTIRSFDVLRPQTSGGGVTAGTNYVIKKISSTTFSLHEYNSSQNGSQGYTNPDTGFFKVHDAYANDTRISINSTNFPTMWWGPPHLPNSGLIKEIVPNGGYVRGTNCMRFHVYRGDGVSDGMAYGVYTPVTQGDTVTVSYWVRPTGPLGYGQYLGYSTYFGAGNSAPGFGTNLNSDGEWQLISHTWTASTTFSFYSYFWPGGSTDIYAIDIADMQVEINQPQATPFVIGSRSQNTTWYDLSGEGNNGTLVNGPTFNSNGYLDFDGTNDNVSIGTVGGYSNQMTCEAWFKTTSGATWKNIICGSTGDIIFTVNGTKLNFGSQGSNPIPHANYSTTNVNDGVWHHGVATYNGSQVKIYVDGVLESTNNRTGNQTPSSLRIGSNNAGSSEFYSGDLALVKLYTKTLTPTEILQNYYQSPIVTDGLVFAVDASNLVSYENGSTTTYSMTGSDTGTLTNGVGFDSGNGGYWDFDGTNDYITISSFANQPTTQITCEAWIKPTKGSVGTGTHRGGAISAANSMYLGIIDSVDGGSTFAMHWANQTSVNRQYNWNGSIPNNAWTHIAGTYNGSVAKAYVNGIEISSWTQTGTIPSSTYYLGTYGGGLTDGVHNFNGDIASARIYNRGLSGAEILQNYNAQKSRFI